MGLRRRYIKKLSGLCSVLRHLEDVGSLLCAKVTFSADKGPVIMRMKRTALLVWLCLAALSSAQKTRLQQNAESDYRQEESAVLCVAAEKGNTRGCANLTLVLDNWKFAIMTQVKDLLLNHHSAVLPDYGRIQPLSEALGDLYKELNTLKECLGELTSRLDRVETFVEDMRAGRASTPSQAQRLAPPSEDMATPMAQGGRQQGHRKRILPKKNKRPQA